MFNLRLQVDRGQAPIVQLEAPRVRLHLFNLWGLRCARGRLASVGDMGASCGFTASYCPRQTRAPIARDPRHAAVRAPSRPARRIAERASPPTQRGHELVLSRVSCPPPHLAPRLDHLPQRQSHRDGREAIVLARLDAPRHHEQDGHTPVPPHASTTAVGERWRGPRSWRARSPWP